MKSFFKFTLKVLVGIILILCPLFVYGQSSWGKLRLICNSSMEEQARSLYERATKNNSAPRSALFQAIAFPAEKLGKAEASVDYVNDEFIVRIGDRELYPNLPNWQLLPIVRFANSSYQGAFTSSGDTGKGEAQLKYHPAFLDNLLGLRLFQAHLLLANPKLPGEIPKDENGNYILAASEEGLMPPPNSNVYITLSGEIKKNTIHYNSYVLTDMDLNIFFDIDGDDLVFSDNPYYYFTGNKVTATKENISREYLEPYYAEIEKYAKTFLADKYTPDLNPRTNLKGLLQAIADNKQNEIFNPYALQYINDGLDKLGAALDQLANKETTSEKFQVMDNLTSLFKRNWPLLKQCNPIVYSAVENISHWAAFFRYVRLSNPNNWTSFLKKVENLKINMHAIQTPTSFVENGN